jgi:hypothetical protein
MRKGLLVAVALCALEAQQLLGETTWPGDVKGPPLQDAPSFQSCLDGMYAKPSAVG